MPESQISRYFAVESYVKYAHFVGFMYTAVGGKYCEPEADPDSRSSQVLTAIEEGGGACWGCGILADQVGTKGLVFPHAKHTPPCAGTALSVHDLVGPSFL